MQYQGTPIDILRLLPLDCSGPAKQRRRLAGFRVTLVTRGARPRRQAVRVMLARTNNRGELAEEPALRVIDAGVAT